MINLNDFFVDFESNIIINFTKEKLSNGIIDLINLKKEILSNNIVLIDEVEYPVNYIEILDKGEVYFFLISVQMLNNKIKMEDNNYVNRIKFK